MDKYVKKFFPKGCPVCGQDVVLEYQHFKYICYGCNAHADCHRESSEVFRKYEPKETMAGNGMHVLRNEVRGNFSKLYRERRFVNGDHGMIESALINIIYPIHLVKEISKGKETFHKVVHRDGDIYKLMSMDSGTISDRIADDLEPASNRDKALVYLAEKFGKDWPKANIGFLNEEQLLKANEIIHRAVQEARSKSLETY